MNTFAHIILIFHECKLKNSNNLKSFCTNNCWYWRP